MTAERGIVRFCIALLSLTLIVGCIDFNRIRREAVQEYIGNLNNKSILLVNVETKNISKPKSLLGITLPIFYKDGVEVNHGYGPWLEVFWYSNDDSELSTDNLLVITIEPGEYQFHSLRGKTLMRLGSLGFFVMPILQEIKVRPNSIVYLGHIESVLRRKENDAEVNAGSVIPLMSQALAGITNSTFDIDIRDEYVSDIDKFIQQCPMLKDVNIEKSILSPWVRPSKEETKFR